MNEEIEAPGAVRVKADCPTLSFQSRAKTLTAMGPEKVRVLNWNWKEPSAAMEARGTAPVARTPSVPVTVHPRDLSMPGLLCLPCTTTVWE